MEDEIKVALVHPNSKQEVVAIHPQQVAALKSQGFVEVEPEQPVIKDVKGNK